jgi:type V secretory pathway adhesin AidA
LAQAVALKADDLPGGWTPLAGVGGSPLAQGAGTSAPLKAVGTGAAARLGQCLSIPPLTADRLVGLGGGSLWVSPSYTDPSTGDSVGSAANLVASTTTDGADYAIADSSTLFTTCYGSYVQTMLAAEKPGVTATLTSTAPPTTAGAGVKLVSFELVEIGGSGGTGGQSVTTITEYTMWFAGRVEAVVATTSNSVFPPDVQNQVLGQVGQRVVASPSS